MRAICFLLVLCVWAFGEVPTARDLLRKAEELGQREEPLRGRYTYFEDQESSQGEGSGKYSKPTVSTYECLFLEGEIYRKLILMDGKPLTAKKQKEVDAELSKEKSQRLEKRRKFGQVKRTIGLGGIGQLLEAHTLSEPRRETVDGRNLWRVDTAPRADLKGDPGKRELLGKQTTFWLDEETGGVVRREDRLMEATNGFEPGSIFRFHFERVNGECWMTKQIEIEGTLRFMKVKTVRFRSVQKYRDFRKFDVESTLTPIAF